ncbi:MAG: hypothetical protein E7516_01600 [Ruminococcaceae bacterium]|nr:hypothetical protein [Oscillospiraceae bacterium]
MIKFIPFDREGATGITALDGDNAIGSCTFAINGYFMVFNSVECDDDIITEGLARSAMNYAANRNAYVAKINRDISSAAFLRLGFSGDDMLSVEIPEALASGCTCGGI